MSPHQLADVVLAPPVDITVDTGLEPGATLLKSGNRWLTYRATPDPFIDYSTPIAEVRVDMLEI